MTMAMNRLWILLLGLMLNACARHAPSSGSAPAPSGSHKSDAEFSWFAPPGASGSIPYSVGIGVQAPQGLAALVPVTTVYGAKCDGVTDDAGKIQTCLTATATAGQACFLPECASPYLIATPILFPDYATLVVAPSASVHSTLPNVDGHTSTPFYANGWASTAVTTLSSNVVQGTPTLVVTSNAGLAIGEDIVVSSQDGAGEMQAGYTIANIVSTTITVDRPVLKPFTSGAAVRASTRGFPRRLTILGNNATMTGTGDRWIQFVMCRDCLVKDLHLNNVTINQIATSYDYGSLRSTFDHVVIDGASSFQWGIGLEDAEFGIVRNSYVSGSGFGIVLNETEESVVVDSTAEATTQAGFYSTYEGAGSRGTHGGGFYRDKAVSCSSNGFQFEFARSVSLVDSVAQYSGGQGVTSFNQSTDLRLQGVRAFNNTANGINLNSGAAYSARLVNVETSSNGSGSDGVYVNMDTQISGLDTAEPGPGISIDQNSIILGVNGWRHNGTVNGFAAAMTVSGASDVVTIENTRVETMAGTGTKFGLEFTGASTIFVDHYVDSAAGTHSGIYADTGAIVRVGAGVDLSATTNGLFNNGAGVVSMAQGNGVFRDAATTGTTTLTQVQAQSTVITSSSSLTGNLTENVPAGIPGLIYTAFNNTTLNGHTWSVGVTGGTAITVAAGKRAVVESDGTNMQRVSPDTLLDLELLKVRLSGVPENDNDQSLPEAKAA